MKENGDSPRTCQVNNANVQDKLNQQFRDPNILCLKCGYRSKEPEPGKLVKYYSCSSPEIQAWVDAGYNVAGTSLTGFAVFIDGDSQVVRDAIESHWNTTFWNTGKPGHRNYLFFLEDEPIEGPIPFKDDVEGYLKTRKGYSVIPPSIHPNGRMYGEEFNDVPVATVKKSELLKVLSPFFKKEKPKAHETREHESLNIDSLRLQDMIELSGFRFRGRYYQGPHPVHGSTTGSNLEVNTNSNLWYCLRHGTGGSVLEWIAVSEGIISCQDAKPGAIRGMTFWEVIAAAHNRYGLEYDKAAEILRRQQ